MIKAYVIENEYNNYLGLLINSIGPSAPVGFKVNLYPSEVYLVNGTKLDVEKVKDFSNDNEYYEFYTGDEVIPKFNVQNYDKRIAYLALRVNDDDVIKGPIAVYVKYGDTWKIVGTLWPHSDYWDNYILPIKISRHSEELLVKLKFHGPCKLSALGLVTLKPLRIKPIRSIKVLTGDKEATELVKYDDNKYVTLTKGCEVLIKINSAKPVHKLLILFKGFYLPCAMLESLEYCQCKASIYLDGAPEENNTFIAVPVLLDYNNVVLYKWYVNGKLVSFKPILHLTVEDGATYVLELEIVYKNGEVLRTKTIIS